MRGQRGRERDPGGRGWGGGGGVRGAISVRMVGEGVDPVGG